MRMISEWDDDAVSPLIFMALLVLFQMFVALLFWYQFYCGFSGSSMVDQWYLIFFNLLFSSLPQLITGVLDKDVPAEVLLSVPQLYKSGQNMEVKASAFCNFFFLRCLQFQLETNLAPSGHMADKKMWIIIVTIACYCSTESKYLGGKSTSKTWSTTKKTSYVLKCLSGGKMGTSNQPELNISLMI